jgi:hypothetical protein
MPTPLHRLPRALRVTALLTFAAAGCSAAPATTADRKGDAGQQGQDMNGDGDGHGDGDDANTGDVRGELGSLLPWAEGNTWTYRVSGSAGSTTKVVTVGALEKVGGSGPNADKMAFRVTTKKGTSDETVSWQAVEGERVLRYREQAFNATTGELALEEHWVPYKIHIDGSASRRKRGSEWVEEYDEIKAPAGMAAITRASKDHWLVEAVDQEVTVPAGTFKAIVYTKAGGTSTKTYWYVPGVGKVRETGGQAEELESYEVDVE